MASQPIPRFFVKLGADKNHLLFVLLCAVHASCVHIWNAKICTFTIKIVDLFLLLIYLYCFRSDMLYLYCVSCCEFSLSVVFYLYFTTTSTITGHESKHGSPPEITGGWDHRTGFHKWKLEKKQCIDIPSLKLT